MTDREIIESIIHHNVDKYQLDATAHTVRLPDLLLRECEQEIQRVCKEFFTLLLTGDILSCLIMFPISCCIYL